MASAARTVKRRGSVLGKTVPGERAKFRGCLPVSLQLAPPAAELA